MSRVIVTAVPAVALLAATLVACSEPARPVTAVPAGEPVAEEPMFAVVYRCPDGTVFTTFPRGDSAQVDFANRSAPAAGAGGSAECEGTVAKDVWDAAKLRGVAWRAVGTEPGWLLEITPGRQMVFAWDYGQQRTAATTPEPQIDAAAGTTVYAAKSDAGDLRVELKNGDCNDGMSDTVYGASATVTLAGKTRTGCARAP
ncbi:MAG: COG3650 family protein [Pseudomonadota bacterium]